MSYVSCPKSAQQVNRQPGAVARPSRSHLSDRARVCRWPRAPSISAPSLKPHLWLYLPRHPQEADVPKRGRTYVHCVTTGFNLSTRLAPYLTVDFLSPWLLRVCWLSFPDLWENSSARVFGGYHCTEVPSHTTSSR